MTDINSRTFDDVPERFDLPDGIYVGTIRRASLDSDVKDGVDRDFIQLFCVAEQVVEVLEDDYGVDVTDDNLKMSFPVKATLWMHTDGAMGMTADFFRGRLGLETGGVPIPDLVEMAQGMQVKFQVSHNISNSGRRYNNIDRFLNL